MMQTYKEYNTEATQLRTALTLGTLTCLQALGLITDLRQRHAAALADVLTDVVTTWHASYVAQIGRMHARRP